MSHEWTLGILWDAPALLFAGAWAAGAARTACRVQPRGGSAEDESVECALGDTRKGGWPPTVTTMTNADPPLRHTPRLITNYGLRQIGDWRIKLYGVGGRSRIVASSLLELAMTVATEALPKPAITSSRYGVGFVIVHEALAFDTIVVDWWEQVNELRHHVFRAPPGNPLEFREITSSGESVCVWELRVQAAEREAWLDNVLLRRSGPDLASYLAAQLREES